MLTKFKLLLLDLDDTLYDRCTQMQETTAWSDVEKISLYPRAREILSSYSGKKYLVTTEKIPGLQRKKIKVLQLEPLFDGIIICNSDDAKKSCFLRIFKRIGCTQNQVLVIGDKIDAELKAGKDLGFTTVRLLQGKYKDRQPSCIEERPDYEIHSFSELEAMP